MAGKWGILPSVGCTGLCSANSARVTQGQVLTVVNYCQRTASHLYLMPLLCQSHVKNYVLQMYSILLNNPHQIKRVRRVLSVCQGSNGLVTEYRAVFLTEKQTCRKKHSLSIVIEVIFKGVYFQFIQCPVCLSCPS